MTKKKNTKNPSIKKPRQLSAQKEALETAIEEPRLEFPVVGVGASAGGLEAFKKLLEHIPANIGMALVLIQHLDPLHASQLPEILSRTSRLKIHEVRNGETLRPNEVFILPPNFDIRIDAGVLMLTKRKQTNGLHMPIDHFFRSLAEQRKSRSIGIVLSGTGSDGTLGLQDIKEQGGITFAQDEKSAKYDGMPRSAIRAGYVDFVAPIEEIAEELQRISNHPYSKPDGLEIAHLQNEEVLSRIFLALRRRKSVDFSGYKRNTIERRLLRRMAVNKINKMAEYARYLEDNPGEVDALFQDILIKVTSFFRDSGFYQALKKRVFPNILKDRKASDPIRIWVPGCATGEEVYSIAICLSESLNNDPTYVVQIFGTDVSDWAVDRARSAQYVENISLDVSAPRLRRFFDKIHGGYRVSKRIREMCVFSRHDVTSDPPFSHLDLVSCRNLLIYLDVRAQRKVVPIFHYALKPNRILALGGSESIASYSELFKVFDQKQSLYQKKEGSPRARFSLSRLENDQSGRTSTIASDHAASVRDAQTETDRLILSRYSPPGVVINENMEILQFRGKTGKYLEPSPGEASLQLLRMAKDGLSIPLRLVAQKAIKQGEIVRKEGVAFIHNNRPRTVDIEVIPIPSVFSQKLFLVAFHDITPPPQKKKIKEHPGMRKTPGQRRETQELQKELEATRQYLQAIIETQEATNEELKSANEEIQSSNEELQSANEELETNKEELQSTNEELNTVNEELQNRNQELDQLNNDLVNILHSINLPILVFGNDLRVRLFTPATQKMLKAASIDVGRSIADLKSALIVPMLENLIHESIETLQVKEVEIQDKEGRWHQLKVRPYRTRDNKIDGAVLVLIDITTIKDYTNELQEARNFAEAIVKTIRQPLLILDSGLCVKRCNDAFLYTFGFREESLLGRHLFEIGNGQWNVPQFRKQVERLQAKGSSFHDVEMHTMLPGVGSRLLLLSGLPMSNTDSEEKLYLLAIEDLTHRRQIEEAAYHRTMLKEIHHRIKNNLQIISSLLHLQASSIDDAKVLQMFKESQNRVKSMALIHEKLYGSSDMARINIGDYVRDLTKNLLRSYQLDDRAISMKVHVPNIFLNIDMAVPLGLILSELVSNSLKYAFPDKHKGEVRIKMEKTEKQPAHFRLTVSDDGVGIPKEVDVHTTPTLGLLLVRKLVEQLDGSMHLEQDGGATFRIEFKEALRTPEF